MFENTKLAISPEDMEKTKEECRKKYDQIKSVICPYFNESISFNNKGFEHLIFKSKNIPRILIDQYIRLKLLPLSKIVLETTHTVQEFQEKSEAVQVNTNSKWNKRIVPVRYWGFVAVLKNTRIKVIVKEIQGGQKHFWSIIPFWKNDKKNDNKKILHVGNMEED